MGLKVKNERGELTTAVQASGIALLAAVLFGGLALADHKVVRPDYRAEAKAKQAAQDKERHKKLVGSVARRLAAWN